MPTNKLTVAVIEVERFPINDNGWCLHLACGHQMFITSKRRPKFKTAKCPERHGKSSRPEAR